MREIEPLKRNEPKEIELDVSDKIKIILNILDKLIAGERFGEVDSSRQMYLLDCQSKLYDMQNGYFTDSSLIFLWNSINELMNMCKDAKDEIKKYIQEGE